MATRRHHQRPSLDAGDAQTLPPPKQIALLYAQRTDSKNAFDELRNQWGFRGYGSQRAVVTELAAQVIESGRRRVVNLAVN